MLKNIILKVIADKKQRNIEPTHALFKEVFDRARLKVSQPMRLEMGLTSFLSMEKLKLEIR